MGEAVSTIVGVLTVALILGAAFIVGRGSNLRATVKDQRDRIESLDGLVDTRTRELTEERTARTALEARLQVVELQASQLSEIVSGRVDYAALETQFAAHHAEHMRVQADYHREDQAALHDIKKLLEARRIGDQREGI